LDTHPVIYPETDMVRGQGTSTPCPTQFGTQSIIHPAGHSNATSVHYLSKPRISSFSGAKDAKNCVSFRTSGNMKYVA
jgi:hypothetical protein